METKEEKKRGVSFSSVPERMRPALEAMYLAMMAIEQGGEGSRAWYMLNYDDMDKFLSEILPIVNKRRKEKQYGDMTEYTIGRLDWFEAGSYLSPLSEAEWTRLEYYAEKNRRVSDLSERELKERAITYKEERVEVLSDEEEHKLMTNPLYDEFDSDRFESMYMTYTEELHIRLLMKSGGMDRGNAYWEAELIAADSDYFE
jgi:hypothetical protein